MSNETMSPMSEPKSMFVKARTVSCGYREDKDRDIHMIDRKKLS